MTALRSLTIIFWMIIALYAGAAGYFACKALENTSKSNVDQYVEYNGLSFENEESLQKFLHDSEGARLFPWIFALPGEFAPVITSIAWGLLGGVALLLKKLATDDLPLNLLHVVIMPVFSAFVGAMLFLLSFLIPTIFVAGRNQARPEALIALSLFGGAFSEQAFLWISEQVVGKLFPSRTKKRLENTGERLR